MPETNVVISYETLFEILRIERSKTELQGIPKNFITDSKKLIEADMDSANMMADEEEQQRKKIHISNTIKIINEIYERRERKIALLALTKAKAKQALVDTSKFLDNERALFEDMLKILNSQRQDFERAFKGEKKEIPVVVSAPV
jgi:DNA replication initiation complex subunit (GINS family)